METDQSLLNVREITKKEGCPRPSSSGQMITESTPLSSFLSLRKKKNKTIVMPRNSEIFSSCTDYKDFCIKYKHYEGTCLIRASAFKWYYLLLKQIMEDCDLEGLYILKLKWWSSLIILICRNQNVFLMHRNFLLSVVHLPAFFHIQIHSFIQEVCIVWYSVWNNVQRKRNLKI